MTTPQNKRKSINKDGPLIFLITGPTISENLYRIQVEHLCCQNQVIFLEVYFSVCFL